MPAFQFLTAQQLETNLDHLLKTTIDKYGDKENIPEDRRKQFHWARWIVNQLQLTNLPEEEKAKIITGALLHIKSAIESACKKNAAWWFEPYIDHPERYIYKPENSIVYSNIDHAIGMTEANLFDEDSEKAVKEAFRPYAWRINLFNDIKEIKITTLKQATEKKLLTLEEEIKKFDAHALHHVSPDKTEKKLPIKTFKKTEAYMNGEGLTKYKYYKLAKLTYKKTLAKEKMSKKWIEDIGQIKEAIKSELGKVITEAFSKKKSTLDFFSKDKEKNKEKLPKEKIGKVIAAIHYSIDTIFAEEIFSDRLNEDLHEKMIDKMVDRVFLEIAPEIKKFDIASLKHVETRVKSIIPFLEELRIDELENTHKGKLSK